MVIGVDFDNTIVCYDRLFHQVCLERSLIPATIPPNKSEVRNYLRSIGQEDAWTEMQGYVYGARMAEADPFPGALEFFAQARQSGATLFIISHKTRHPFKGEPYDLHSAAVRWLEQQGFFDPERIGLSRSQLFLELTKDEKLRRIAQCNCDWFIDDLPEFLSDSRFPSATQRILFDSSALYPTPPGMKRISHWKEAWEQLGTGTKLNPPASVAAQPVIPNELELESVGPFLELHGFSRAATFSLITGGGNNRLLQVREGDKTAVLKAYYRSPNDPRDRFGAEKRFYAWIEHQQIRRAPKAIGWDETHHLGLLSFVEGKKLNAGQITRGILDQALDFVAELNQRPDHELARAIGPASEACFSLEEHIRCVQRRIDRLLNSPPILGIDQEAAGFVRTSLEPAWQRIRDRIASAAAAHNIPLDESLPATARCLSPSDFGFHNALLPADLTLRFFDFEYAGWDDPAKLLGDFFCQQQVPVSLEHWPAFRAGLAERLHLDATTVWRAGVLLPGYGIKWCCIILNEFVAPDLARRTFARSDILPEEARKHQQLERARKFLDQLHCLEQCDLT